MDSVYETLPFDDLDGGVWKQGWNVTYKPDSWSAESPLNVWVVSTHFHFNFFQTDRILWRHPNH